MKWILYLIMVLFLVAVSLVLMGPCSYDEFESMVDLGQGRDFTERILGP